MTGMIRMTLADLANAAHVAGVVVDEDREENIATAAISGVLHYAVIPAAVSGGAA